MNEIVEKKPGQLGQVWRVLPWPGRLALVSVATGLIAVDIWSISVLLTELLSLRYLILLIVLTLSANGAVITACSSIGNRILRAAQGR